MHFSLSDDQEMLRNAVERFAADRCKMGTRSVGRADPLGFAAASWSAIADLGLLGLPFAEADGGLGGGTVELITMLEAAGYGLMIEPLLEALVLGGMLVAAAANPQQRQSLLPGIIDGTHLVAFAHAEHGSGFTLVGDGVQARQDRLTGAKTFVPAWADSWIVTAIDGDEPALFLVSATASGLSRRDYRLVDGSFATELHFDSTLAERLPGGWVKVEEVLDTARIAAAAEMIGIMARLFRETLEYVRQRRQFGATIGSFQAVQHRLADVYASLELSRSQLYRGALATPETRRAAIAGAKSFISDAAIRLGEECIQLHGGMGVSDDLLIGHGHKRLLILAKMFGDADHEISRYHAALVEGHCAPSLDLPDCEPFEQEA